MEIVTAEPHPAQAFVDWIGTRFADQDDNVTFAAFRLDGFTVVAARGETAEDLEAVIAASGGRVQIAGSNGKEAA
jgi:hypothetical protein